MAYVPVKLWVPDTAIVSEIHLKLCEVCHVTVPEQLSQAHMEEAHPEDVETDTPEQR